MKRLMALLALLAIVSAAWIMTGCQNSGVNDNAVLSDQASASMSTPMLESVWPPDGATGVPTSTGVMVSFNMSMDTGSVMANFYLVGGEQMWGWMDSLNHHGNMGGMGGTGMMDTAAMLDHLGSMHTPGQFHWSQAGDSFMFVPGSMLMPNTDYMIVMNQGGMSGGQGGMGGHGGMMGTGNSGEGIHISHFTTGGDVAAPTTPMIMSVWPPDSMWNVPTACSLSMTFNMPMDTGSVMGSFHLVGGEEMWAWMDSLGHDSGMCDTGMMMDTLGMHHYLDSIHVPGQFHWNDMGDSLMFVPDSMLLPNTDYMFMLFGEVHAMDGTMMEMHQSGNGYMYHFQTEDAQWPHAMRHER